MIPPYCCRWPGSVILSPIDSIIDRTVKKQVVCAEISEKGKFDNNNHDDISLYIISILPYIRLYYRMIYITYIVISIISIVLRLDGQDIPKDFFNKKNDQHHIYVENGVAYVCNQKCISSKWLVAQADEIRQPQEKTNFFYFSIVQWSQTSQWPTNQNYDNYLVVHNNLSG